MVSLMFGSVYFMYIQLIKLCSILVPWQILPNGQFVCGNAYTLETVKPVLAKLWYITIPVHGLPECCDGIKCVKKFCSADLNNCLQHYAQDVDNTDYKRMAMVEGIFIFFEALLNYEGKCHLQLRMSIQVLLCHMHTCICL